MAQFKFIGNDGAFDKYQMTIELPNDGTPESERYLQIDIMTSAADDEDSLISLNLLTPNAVSIPKSIPIAEYYNKRDKDIANLLYPVAKLKTKTIIVPR